MQEQEKTIYHVLDDKKRAEIIGLLTVGCSRRKAAQYVGCAPSTITRAVCRDPEFAAQVARAEQNIETLALANIRAACKQERYWRASAWVLEHCNPEDFATRPPDVMTPDKVNQLLTQFTEVILRELPTDQWQHVTTALDEFIQATQQEIRDSQPGQGDCPNFCVSKNGTVPFDAVDSPTQQSATETAAPINAATSSTPILPVAEPATSADSLHSLDSGLAAIDRMIALIGGPAALAPAAAPAAISRDCQTAPTCPRAATNGSEPAPTERKLAPAGGPAALAPAAAPAAISRYCHTAPTCPSVAINGSEPGDCPDFCVSKNGTVPFDAPTERKLALAGGPAAPAAPAATQRPSNGQCDFTTPTPSTTPETAATWPCNTRPKEATPTQGRCVESVAPRQEPDTV